MQKFHVLTFLKEQELVLQALQNFECAELLPAENGILVSENHFVKENANSEIEQLENKLTQVLSGREFLTNFLPKAGLLQKLRQKPKTYSLSELNTQFDALQWEELLLALRKKDKRLRTLEQEKQELSQAEDELNRWQYFDDQPEILTTLKQSVGYLGTLPNEQFPSFTHDLAKYPSSYYEIIQQTSTTTYLLILIHKTNHKLVERLLLSHGFAQYHYPFVGKPANALAQIKEKRQAVLTEEAMIKAELQKMQTEFEQLTLVAEILNSKIVKLKNQELLLQSKSITSLAGWVPKSEADRLEKALAKATNDHYYLVFAEVSEQEIAEVPILLENNRWVAPFESLVEMYSLPKYDEIDPTPFMAPFYALAFGMMVADFGYGLVLFLAILLAKKFFYFEASMGRMLTFFQLSAVPTMMWGLIYGSFFGVTMPIQLLSSQSDITEILLISVLFGYIQIFFALILKFYLLWNHKKQKVKAIFQAGSWMLFLISGALLAIGFTIIPDGPWTQVGLIGLIASLIGVVIGGSFEGETFAGKIGTGLYGLMDLTNYMSDLVSYTRLMALGVAGGSIAAAFNLIISYFPPVARYTLGIGLFILLHGINIFLSYLGAYVHGLRLQYLEFFGKFFEGGGRAFKPLKASGKYVNVNATDNNKQEEQR